jgi:hypothetical protein
MIIWGEPGYTGAVSTSFKKLRFAAVVLGIVVSLAACTNSPTHQPNNNVPTGTVPTPPGGTTGGP